MRKKSMFSDDGLYGDSRSSVRICDAKGCKLEGEHRAPKTRELKDYYHFCLKHVKDYNKNWNFFKDMSVEEVEESLEKDKFGECVSSFGFRASEEIMRKGQDPLGFFESLRGKRSKKGTNISIRFTAEEDDAIDFLGLKHSFTAEDLKVAFKKLAKKYHPDVNENSKSAESKFKELIVKHDILKGFLLKK